MLLILGLFGENREMISKRINMVLFVFRLIVRDFVNFMCFVNKVAFFFFWRFFMFMEWFSLFKGFSYWFFFLSNEIIDFRISSSIEFFLSRLIWFVCDNVLNDLIFFVMFIIRRIFSFVMFIKFFMCICGLFFGNSEVMDIFKDCL